MGLALKDGSLPVLDPADKTLELGSVEREPVAFLRPPLRMPPLAARFAHEHPSRSSAGFSGKFPILSLRIGSSARMSMGWSSPGV